MLNALPDPTARAMLRQWKRLLDPAEISWVGCWREPEVKQGAPKQ